MERKVALIGLGAIGTPIAHKLYKKNNKKFVLVANEERKKKLLSGSISINGEIFKPNIVSSADDIEILIVCIKNYDLEKSIVDFKKVINDKTIILPLQNGIYSYDFFKTNFPRNVVLHGYVQGPNTKKNEMEFTYENAGVMHIGCVLEEENLFINQVYEQLKNADVDVCLEKDIKKMVWKKWMLNVVGNSITGLTEADYSDFKREERLQDLCKIAMNEFLKISQIAQIGLDQTDVNDVLQYYMNYSGCKRTSMLEDICNERRTENEYLAGKIVEIAKKNGIEIPVIQTLYYLISIKETLYLEKGKEK